MYINLILYGLYMLCMIASVTVGALNWPMMRTPMRLFYFFTLMVLVNELAALAVELQTGSNSDIYHFGDIVQTAILSVYFGIWLKRLVFGIGLSVLSVAFGVLNYFLFQHSEPAHNYFLLWSGLLVILLSLASMISLYNKSGPAKLFRFAHFWIAVSLLFYWSTNLLGLQLFNTLTDINMEYALFLNIIHVASNIIVYSAIGTVFYYSPRLIQ